MIVLKFVNFVIFLSNLAQHVALWNEAFKDKVERLGHESIVVDETYSKGGIVFFEEKL